jgi:multidrug transporter EmrE-like cation transporter
MSLVQILGLTLVEIVGDFGYKQFANHGGIWAFMVGTVGYIGVIVMLIISLQHSTVLMVNGAWDGISGLTESAAAYIFLGERFQHPYQYIGLVMIAFGLYLLKIPTTKTKPFVLPRLFV